MPLSVRAIAATSLALVVLTATSCGGGARYAGLTQGEATAVAKARIEAKLDPTKRPYYETSIWNVATEHGETAPGAPAWLIGIWNGQTQHGDCALASRVNGTNHVQFVSCSAFPKYAR
jgi:hypothetical protein